MTNMIGGHSGDFFDNKGRGPINQRIIVFFSINLLLFFLGIFRNRLTLIGRSGFRKGIIDISDTIILKKTETMFTWT